MNSYDTTAALAAIRRDELIAEARDASIVRDCRAGRPTKRRGRTAQPIRRTSRPEPVTEAVCDHSAAQPDVATRHPELTGGRR